MSKAQFGTLLAMMFIAFSSTSQTPKYNSYFFHNSVETADVAPYPLQVMGTMFFDETWNAGNIHLENGDSLIGYFIRYDMLRNSLEIIIDRRFHAISPDQILAFEWFSGERLDIEKFVRRDEFALSKDEYAVDFVELLVDGELSLIKSTIVVPRQGSTSPSLVPENAKGSDMLIIEKYYFVKGGKSFEISSRKNPNLEFLELKEVRQYVRENRLSFTSEGDLKMVAKHYNLVRGE